MRSLISRLSIDSLKFDFSFWLLYLIFNERFGVMFRKDCEGDIIVIPFV